MGLIRKYIAIIAGLILLSISACNKENTQINDFIIAGNSMPQKNQYITINRTINTKDTIAQDFFIDLNNDGISDLRFYKEIVKTKKDSIVIVSLNTLNDNEFIYYEDTLYFDENEPYIQPFFWVYNGDVIDNNLKWNPNFKCHEFYHSYSSTIISNEETDSINRFLIDCYFPVKIKTRSTNYYGWIKTICENDSQTIVCGACTCWY
jgi:hypothetical protein